MLNQETIDELINISTRAGMAILDVYESEFNFKIKDDLSPLTKADLLSHKIISSSLKKLTPNIPVLSEESSDIPFAERSKWKEYWLVDPLDGTKEFIKKNGEFTTNIALIRKNRPVLGIIYAPAKDLIFWGSEFNGSFMRDSNNNISKITVSDKATSTTNVVSSRSHKSDAEEDFLRTIGKYREHPIGSSLKFCLLASGEADVYPRFGPTSEWDIAAGDALLSFAGGGMVDKYESVFQYNVKEDFLNTSFFAFGNKELKEKLYPKFLKSVT